MSLLDESLDREDYIGQVFGAGGILSRHFEGYEARPGQVELARAVDRAMRERRHALGEGPCGTGKSVAYIVPASYRAARFRKRTIIVTANIALQEQLVNKDLPMLASLLPWEFTYALYKGRDNYYCRDRGEDFEGSSELDDIRRGGFRGDDADAAHAQVERVLRWTKSTQTGDKSELPFVPASSLWQRLAVSSEDCKGRDCRFYRDSCFSQEAKKTAHRADIIVTNYHMLFAHMSVGIPGKVLPVHDYLVLDEAHEASDVAREFFGFKIGAGAASAIAKYARTNMRDEDLARRIRDSAEALFEEIGRYGRRPDYDTRVRTPGFVELPDDLMKGIEEVGRYAANVVELAEEGVTDSDDLEVSSDDAAKAKIIQRRASALQSRLIEAVNLTDQNKVYFIEEDRRGPKLCAKLISVAEVLKGAMFDATRSVSLVSATLTTEGTFKFVRGEVGAPDDAIQVIAESPFDFKKQAIMITPSNLPTPEAPDFIDAVAAAVREVIALCGGRTLCLFTSNKNMNGVHRLIEGEIEYTLLKQGQKPRTELSREFKSDTRSVLLGTNSFWTGIDVPGEALTGLVIDKLPFPNKSDPVLNAICEKDPKAFYNYQIPRAVIMLRQGVGRLIRSQKDVGVVVILDRRLIEKGYSSAFFKSLPPMFRSKDLSSIKNFLESGEVPLPVLKGKPGRSFF